MDGKWARLLLKAFSSDVRAPSSSIETHSFIANGFDVRANLSDHVLDRLRSQAVRTKRSERAKVETAAVNF